MMAIPCPECGREYDVTLFQFGRTIRCTCGARVGLEKRIGLTKVEPEPRFMADAMLGGLARWLRLLGIDTAFDPHIADQDLVRRSFQEERWILTRDRRLPEEWTLTHCTLLISEEVEGQLQEVLERFPIPDKLRLFSRCPLCNHPLESLSREEARSRVPARVFRLHDAFQHCPDCRQVYWEGTHTQRIRERIRTLLAHEGRR